MKFDFSTSSGAPDYQGIKLYRKVIVFCWRVADREKIQLRQRYSRTVRDLLLQQRFRNHPKNYKQAQRAQKRMKTIAGRLLREIQRKVPEPQLIQYSNDVVSSNRILSQKKNDKNKIYSFHSHRKPFKCRSYILNCKSVSGFIVQN